MGHDIGVRVSYRYCLDHEAEVDRLALLDGTHPLEQLGPQTPKGVRERWHSYFHQIPGPGGAPGARQRGGLPASFLPQLVGEPGHDVRRGGGGICHGVLAARSAAGGGFSYYRGAAYEDPPDWRADADRALDIPALYLWGERRQRTSAAGGLDPEASWQRAASNLRTQFIAGGGRFLHEAKPDGVNAALLAFLGEIGN